MDIPPDMDPLAFIIWNLKFPETPIALTAFLAILEPRRPWILVNVRGQRRRWGTRHCFHLFGNI
jgi:hypothetical protein